MKDLIQPSELLKIKHQSNLILLDARAGGNAAERFAEEHLQNAQFVDVETELAEKPDNAAHGGRHPLPSLFKFAAVLGQKGVRKNSRVVIYDDKNAANAAARLWWMLKAVGHNSVQVLDGGLQNAKYAGFPTTSETTFPIIQKPYWVNIWLLPTVNILEVEKAAQSPSHTVIDVRDAYRFDGESEPIDLIAGHIPGAINIPFTENLAADGHFLSPKTLKKKYQMALKRPNTEGVIVHCGSGITACHTLLAMSVAGLSMPKLYVGSWSEWSRNDKAIGKKD